MKMIVLAVRDRAADAFGRPFYNFNRGSAIRNFGDEINRQHEENPMASHSEDFDLYELGEFNDNDGSFKLHERPVQIAIGKDLKQE